MSGKKDKRNLPKGLILFWAVWIVLLIVFCLHPISGNSMEPTYTDGEWVLCIRFFSAPERGDVVVASVPSERELIIKRVAGVPGDTVTLLADGSVLVNGEPYSYGTGSALPEFYLYAESLTDTSESGKEIVLGEDEYFLLGDNREHSKDSRYWGAFSREEIRQKVILSR